MNIVLSVTMLTAFALVLGAVALFRRGVRKQAWLMLALALIMIVNVVIWSMPVGGGSLANPAPQAGTTPN